MASLIKAQALLKEAKDIVDDDAKKALAVAKESEKLFRKLGDVGSAREALRIAVGATLAKGNVEDALQMVSSEISDARSSGDDAGIGLMLLTSSEVEMYQDNKEKALHTAQEARQIFKKLNDSKMEARAARLECIAHHLLDDGINAPLAAEAAQKLAEIDGDKETLALVWHMMATTRLATSQNNGPKTVSQLQATMKARDCYRELGDQKSEALMLSNMSRLLLVDERDQDALQPALKAVKIFESLGLVSAEVNAWQFALVAMISNGQTQQCLSMMKDRLAAFDKADQRAAHASLMLVVADCHFAEEDASKAIRVSREALDAFAALGDRRQQAAVALKIATLEFEQDGFDEALKAAEQAQMLYRDLGVSGSETEASHMIAHIYTAKGEPEKSPFRQESLTLLESMVHAVEQRDDDAYEKAAAALDAKGSITGDEKFEALKPLLEQDNRGVRDYLKAKGVEQVGPVDTARHFDEKVIYSNYRKGGLQYGPAFRGIKGVWRHGAKGNPDTEVLAVVQLPEDSESWETKLQILHPGLSDSCLQSTAAMVAE